MKQKYEYKTKRYDNPNYHRSDDISVYEYLEEEFNKFGCNGFLVIEINRVGPITPGGHKKQVIVTYRKELE